ncbi:hypothetical protein [Granulicella sibirica]|uniref:hypothetical protein n=1 Tax=Granulicella sibirica TaxID=2479048 RepID=UPI0010093696|nr:hypothetical protein [Granulicella sibirica]
MSRTRRTCRLLALTAALSLAARLPGIAQKTVYETTPPQRSATVTVLALSTAVHQGFAGNQDTFLADIAFKDGDHQTARLIDLYPSSDNPIQRTLFTAHRQFHMRLIRTPRCDGPAKDFFLYQGDAYVYDGSARTTLAADPSALIPCYKIVHTQTKLIKK